MAGLIYVILFFFQIIPWSLSQPFAEIGQGQLTGLYMNTLYNRRISAFLGIPYAKPPVGKHRFKESIPATPWMGVYNATTPPEDCLQYTHFGYKTTGSEDCLYLNVYTPELPNKTGKIGLMDVIVNIHGGAFMFLSGSYYQPDYLLDRDVVLVNINYRLGALGFLSTEDANLPGNIGMKDQVLALKWVKNNIASFGGNPNSITIVGLSAGGASVHYHVLSPLSQGLFNKAVMAGGSALNPWTQVEGAREKTLKIAHHLGCPTNDTRLVLKCLRERPAINIVSATKLFLPWLYTPFSPFGIVVEAPGPSAFISENPIDTIMEKKAKDIPILITMNSDEGLYPGAEIISLDKYMDDIDNKWNEYLPFVLDYNYTAPAGQKDIISSKIRDFYLQKAGHVKEDKAKFIKMLGDRLFYVGIIRSAQLHAEHYTSPIYSYLFSHKGVMRLADFFNLGPDDYEGTSHGDDFAYIMKATYMPSLENSQADKEVSKRMLDYWMAFIKGEPMPKNWPTVKENLPNFGFLEIQNANPVDDVVRIETDYGNEKFWNSLNLNENLQGIPIKEEL